MPRCAWVVLVMIGDEYVPGALVLAESIRETCTRHDLVCMVTEDVSDSARRALAKLYTRVVCVPYLTMTRVPAFPTAKQRLWYKKWINHSFTKWNIFDPARFADYDRLILLDADIVFVHNCDHLFTMNAPAMTFSTPWAVPYCNNGGIRNYYLNPHELAHGESVPHDAIRRARRDGFVGRGSMVLVAPNMEIFDAVRSAVERGLSRSRCASGFDEQLLADVLLQLAIPVFNIHQQYNWVVGKDAWLVPAGCDRTSTPTSDPSIYQWYGIPKPWRMHVAEWPDLRLWWNIANALGHFDEELSRFFRVC